MSTGQGPIEPASTAFTPGGAWRELGEYLGKLTSDGRLLRPGDLVATVRRHAEAGEPGWARLLSQLHTEVTNTAPRQPSSVNPPGWERDPEADVLTQARQARQNSDRYTEFLNQHQTTRPAIRAAAPRMRQSGTDTPMDAPTRRLGAERTGDTHASPPPGPGGQARARTPVQPRLSPTAFGGDYPPPATISAVTTGEGGVAPGGFGPSGQGGFGPPGAGADGEAGTAPGNDQHGGDPAGDAGIRAPATPPASGTLPTGPSGELVGQQRASFLQVDEQDEIFGTDERTTPPVIGE